MKNKKAEKQKTEKQKTEKQKTEKIAQKDLIVIYHLQKHNYKTLFQLCQTWIKEKIYAKQAQSFKQTLFQISRNQNLSKSFEKLINYIIQRNHKGLLKLVENFSQKDQIIYKLKIQGISDIIKERLYFINIIERSEDLLQKNVKEFQEKTQKLKKSNNKTKFSIEVLLQFAFDNIDYFLQTVNKYKKKENKMIKDNSYEIKFHKKQNEKQKIDYQEILKLNRNELIQNFTYLLLIIYNTHQKHYDVINKYLPFLKCNLWQYYVRQFAKYRQKYHEAQQEKQFKKIFNFLKILSKEQSNNSKITLNFQKEYETYNRLFEHMINEKLFLEHLKNILQGKKEEIKFNQNYIYPYHKTILIDIQCLIVSLYNQKNLQVNSEQPLFEKSEENKKLVNFIHDMHASFTKLYEQADFLPQNYQDINQIGQQEIKQINESQKFGLKHQQYMSNKEPLRINFKNVIKKSNETKDQQPKMFRKQSKNYSETQLKIKQIKKIYNLIKSICKNYKKVKQISESHLQLHQQLKNAHSLQIQRLKQQLQNAKVQNANSYSIQIQKIKQEIQNIKKQNNQINQSVLKFILQKIKLNEKGQNQKLFPQNMSQPSSGILKQILIQIQKNRNEIQTLVKFVQQKSQNVFENEEKIKRLEQSQKTSYNQIAQLKKHLFQMTMTDDSPKKQDLKESEKLQDQKQKQLQKDDTETKINSQLELKEKQHQNKLNQSMETIKKLEKEVQDLKLQKSQLQKKLNELHLLQIQKNQKKQKNVEEITSISQPQPQPQQIKQKQNQKNHMQTQTSQIKEKEHKDIIKLEIRCQLFNKTQNNQYKKLEFSQRIIQNIEKVAQNKKIVQIDKIYKYTQNLNQLFSKFTKTKTNLLVIGKTEHQQIFGGFTSQGFGNQTYDDCGYGFLFTQSLKDKTQINFFNLKKSDKLPSECLKEQIKFGYRELIIKMVDKKWTVQTDFATPRHQSRGHYQNSLKLKREEFMNLNEKETKVLDYQIYEIVFDDQKIIKKKQYNEMSNKIQNLQRTLKQKEEQIKKISIQLQQVQKVQKSLNLENSQNLQNIKKLNENNEELQKEIKKLAQQLKQKDSKIMNLEEGIQTLKKKHRQELNQIQSSKNIRIKQLEQKLSEVNEKLAQLQEKNKNLAQVIFKNNLQIQRLSNQNKIDWESMYKEEKQQSQKIIQQKAKSIENLTKQNIRIETQWQQKINKLQQKLSTQLNDKIKSYEESMQKLKNQLATIKQIYQLKNLQAAKKVKNQKQKDQKIAQLQKQLASNRFYEMYFQGDVFDSEPYDQLVWFVDQLQKNCEMRIRKTRLLYRKDDYSNVNFHVYFDNLQDIVLVIKLKNGMVLAGYTHPAFIKGQKQPGQTGFIFSFHTRQVFGQKREGVQSMDPRPRPITYDEYYMIFGNSQIRLRFRQDMLFSNFGIMGSFYDNKKQPVDCLLGQDKQRESQILTYQIFQVKF